MNQGSAGPERKCRTCGGGGREPPALLGSDSIPTLPECVLPWCFSFLCFRWPIWSIMPLIAMSISLPLKFRSECARVQTTKENSYLREDACHVVSYHRRHSALEPHSTAYRQHLHHTCHSSCCGQCMAILEHPFGSSSWQGHQP